MPRFRFTVDIEAATLDEARCANLTRWGNIVGIDQFPDDGRLATLRSITFYRRATISTDTASDFLPGTQPCQADKSPPLREVAGLAESCMEISEVLIGWSNGEEQRVCLTHLQEFAGVLLQRELTP